MGYWVVVQADIGHPLIVSSLRGAFMDIAQLLTFSVKQGASDLHLSAGVEPMIRVDGDVKRINLTALEHKNVHDMVSDIMNDKKRKDWDKLLDTDYSFEIQRLVRSLVIAIKPSRTRRAVSQTSPTKKNTQEKLIVKAD